MASGGLSMSSDRNLYTDIAAMSGTGGISHLFPRPLTYGTKDMQQIDQTLKFIRENVMLLGRQLADAHLSNPPIDPIRLMGYDQLYNTLITVLSSPQSQYPPYAAPQTSRQVAFPQPSQDNVLVNIFPPNAATSYVDDRERVENDIFWNVIYEIFPEWREKKTSLENAVYFHRFLEKKNYDSHHRFRGQSLDKNFTKRMECFLDEVEKRGLDWTKCLRKLKRRCCDLIRYERNAGGRGDSEVRQTQNYPNFLSLIGDIAKHDLNELQNKSGTRSNSVGEKDSAESTFSSTS